MMNMQPTETRKSSLGFATSGSVISMACIGLLAASACFLLPKQVSLHAAVACPSLAVGDQDTYAVLSQDIRAAKSVEHFQPDQLVLAAGKGQVTYAFDAAKRTLTRRSDGQDRVLLTGVESFSFSILHRAGPGAPFGTLAPATISDAKAVACHWSCSRTLAGAKLDSETFEMAPVLLRNHH